LNISTECKNLEALRLDAIRVFLRSHEVITSVASWAIFPHNCAVFFIALRDFFCCYGLRFFGLVWSKCMRFFGLFLRKILLSKSIVFVNFA